MPDVTTRLKPNPTVAWVSSVLEEALALVGDDPERAPMFDDVVDLIRVCRAVQLAKASLNRTAAELAAIDAELAETRAEMAQFRGQS